MELNRHVYSRLYLQGTLLPIKKNYKGGTIPNSFTKYIINRSNSHPIVCTVQAPKA